MGDRRPLQCDFLLRGSSTSALCLERRFGEAAFVLVALVLSAADLLPTTLYRQCRLLVHDRRRTVLRVVRHNIGATGVAAARGDETAVTGAPGTLQDLRI